MIPAPITPQQRSIAITITGFVRTLARLKLVFDMENADIPNMVDMENHLDKFLFPLNDYWRRRI